MEKTRKYEVSFNGREVKAIGGFSNYRMVVRAKDEEKAKLKIYDTHEHLTNVVIKEIK